MILAEPRGRVPVVLQDGAERAVLLPDDRVVARESRRDFAHHPEAGHVVVAPGDQGRARRRAERRGVEVGVTQPVLRDTIQCRRRNDPAERARRAEPGVVRHDEQHVGRALRRHDAWRPPRCRIRRLLLDHPAERRIGLRKLLAVEGGRGAGRAQFARDLLRPDGCDGQRGNKQKRRDLGDDTWLSRFSAHAPCSPCSILSCGSSGSARPTPSSGEQVPPHQRTTCLLSPFTPPQKSFLADGDVDLGPSRHGPGFSNQGLSCAC